MASTALPHTTHSQESLQHQYMAASSPDEAPRTGAGSPVQPPSSDNVTGETASSDYSNYVSRGQPDPYQYAEASVTSGSNSGEEDDRDLGGMTVAAKRLGGHLNGFSSKKRRKQSKPIRLGSGGEADDVPSQSGQDQGRDEDDEGLVNSTTPELEDGERRPQLPFPMTSLPSDLPLNLSAAAAAAHPTLRVLGAELLQNPDRIPTTVASMYQGMLGPFGLPPFPFPFPSSSRPPPTSMSGTTPPVTAGGRIQIFNPEAYCELCNKEFCNKYFLKTHKANKHGIYSEGVPMSGSPPTSSSPSNGPAAVSTSEAGPSSERPLPPTSQASHGPPTPNSQAGSPFSGAFIAANMGSMRPNFVPLSPGASPSPKDQSNRDLLNRDAPSRESQSGGGAGDSPSGLRSHPPSMMSPREGSIPDFRQAVEERERLMQREGGPLPPTPKENGELRKSLESPQRAPSAGLPGLPQHLNFNPMMFGGLPSLESLRKEEMDGKRPPIPNIPNVPNVSNASSGGGGPGSFPKGPFTPEKLRQMGVINADAFCEICCKEFCNKYFLRVHKLKKHGICSPDLPPEKVQKILNQMAKEAGKTGNPPPPIVRPPMTSSSPFNSSGPNSPEKRPMPMGPGGMPLRPPGLMSLPPLEPLLPHALKDFKTQMPPPNFDNGPAPFRPPPTSSSGTPQKNQRDEVIRINEDSEDGRSDLKDRDDDEDNSRGENGGAGSDEEGETRRPSEDLQRLQSMIMELNSGKAAAAAAAAGMLPPPPLSSNVNKEENTICKVCNKDMENKYFLRAHMMNEHGVLEDPSAEGKEPGSERSLPPPPPLLNGLDMANAQDFAAKFLQQMQKGFGVAGLPPLDGDERSFLERVKSELAAVGNGPPPPPGSGPLGSPSPTGHKKMEKDPNRKPASLSRSYCDICKKELCNKYFMKTHMLKMHGINIEATNSAGVNCHICKKELCSKYFLKVHMQNSHGLMEDGSPIPPHLKENGSGLFPGMFPPLGPPPHELMAMGNGNGNPPTTSSAAEKEHYFSRLLGEQSEMSKEKLERQQKMLKETGGGNSPHTCSLCGEGFPEIVALQVHIIKSHGAFPPDSGLFGGLENKMPPLVPASEAAQGSPSGSNGGSDADNSKSKEDRSEGEVTPNKAPSTPVQQPPPTSGPCTPTSEALNKQFPHLEMLQRHMLSQQFPGLINPLLSGFPGFPGGPPPLAFANPLQQLLAGGGNGAVAGSAAAGGNSGQTSTQEEANAKKEDKSSKKRRFKCSKCQSKFGKREDCLRHIHAQHSSSSGTSRRRLQFSPKILKNRHGVRSHYVKRLMEILRVPTSRGTPSKSQAGADNHIMQAFLIKKDSDMEEAKEDFVPSMVYLPVARKINQPMTVAFSLTPA